ncbi:hypothetical protein [Limisalsivibrio acetivorans]|uniref:hypothetical protein n=1 Tax=Limisalsivibrio acetivorans TaxID=1304888 RepID=UPI0003B6E73B|nr:hypothetical protein [Limisalsivibrio acetivorans]
MRFSLFIMVLLIPIIIGCSEAKTCSLSKNLHIVPVHYGVDASAGVPFLTALEYDMEKTLKKEFPSYRVTRGENAEEIDLIVKMECVTYSDPSKYTNKLSLGMAGRGSIEIAVQLFNPQGYQIDEEYLMLNIHHGKTLKAREEIVEEAVELVRDECLNGVKPAAY